MYSIGIDMGGTNTDLGLVSEQGAIVERRSVKTNQYTNFPIYVKALADAINEMLQKHGLAADALEGIGIGAPNANFYTGCVENAMNLTMKGILNYREEFGKYFPTLPVAICNDASAAAYGEHIYGGAKHLNDFVLFTLGTGVGSGIVSAGKLLLGTKGAAGELGHIQIVPNGRQCSCGLRGCVEAYCSARGIKQTYAELRAAYDSLHRADTIEHTEGWIDHHTPLCDISCRNIGDAANAGDPIAREAFAITADYLATAMATAVAFSAPQAIFLMGGPVEAGAPLMEPLQVAFRKHLLYTFEGTCTIQRSQMNTNDVAILGASALIKMIV